MSIKRAHAISNGIFLVSLFPLIVTNAWWPGILLVLFATVSSRQYLSGRPYYACISAIVFLGLFVIEYFKLYHAFLVPVLLVVGGVVIIIREYFFPEDTNGEDKSIEIEEDADINE